ncbi:MAG: glutathione S-transferase [Erythrobacter sp.]
MSEAALPILYSFRRCPYAMRGRMALSIAGITCELREVKLANKPPELLEISPKATVPVLILADGTVLEESLEIMQYALGQNDPEGWQNGDDTDLIARNDGAFKHHLDRYKYPTRYPDEAGGDEQTFRYDHRAHGLKILEQLNERLQSQSFLNGQSRTLADIAIFPFIRQFANTDRDWFDELPLQPLQEWLEAHLASDLFANIMGKYTPWAAGDKTTLLAQ